MQMHGTENSTAGAFQTAWWPLCRYAGTASAVGSARYETPTRYIRDAHAARGAPRSKILFRFGCARIDPIAIL